jgi:hypothetical protein
LAPFASPSSVWCSMRDALNFALVGGLIFAVAMGLTHIVGFLLGWLP